VVNRLDNTVSILTINATNGALTLVASVATGSELFRIAIDLSGHLASYNLKSNGTSTPQARPQHKAPRYRWF
jgi:hypothetical protein